MVLQVQLYSGLLCVILLAAIPSSENFDVNSSPTVTGIVGQDVVLPCEISTRTQPANMEVQWKKIIQSQLEIVHEYRAQTDQDVPGQKYQGRTALLKDGFTSGNVSLKLKNVRPIDGGKYNCIVKSNEWSTDALTELKIAGDICPDVSKWEAAFGVSFTLNLLAIGAYAVWKYKEKLVKKNDQPKEEKDEKELRRLQEEIDELQVELNELQVELKWRRTQKYADHITLNADTAHPNLSIDGEMKSFTHEAQPKKVKQNPERFDSTVCVLGSEGFSYGKHYWEMKVENSTDWDLGVARKSIERKGKISMSPKEGFWVLGRSVKDYWAKTDPWTRVMVKKKPKKIGVYLSYEDGQVTIFNVTDMSVLFTFNHCSFSGKVYPFFKNSHRETLMRICSIREDE